MSGDEALGRVAMDARADTRLLFDEKGDLLNPHNCATAMCSRRAEPGT